MSVLYIRVRQFKREQIGVTTTHHIDQYRIENLNAHRYVTFFFSVVDTLPILPGSVLDRQRYVGPLLIWSVSIFQA